MISFTFEIAFGLKVTGFVSVVVGVVVVGVVVVVAMPLSSGNLAGL
jgi:tetrahydromethanopterin S-methyltransferase subunit F